MTKSNFRVIVPASTVPVSVQNLNQHLNLFGDNSYALELGQLLLTAQEFVSNHIGKFISDTTIEIPFASFDDLTLPHDTASSVVVRYYDANNAIQTLDDEDYIVDPTGLKPVISFKVDPETSSDYQNPILIQYVTGMPSVPQVIRHAILMTAAELFEVRTESTEAKERMASITISRLLKADKRIEV